MAIVLSGGIMCCIFVDCDGRGKDLHMMGVLEEGWEVVCWIGRGRGLRMSSGWDRCDTTADGVS